MSLWKKLDIDNWPEESRIYCDDCGQKIDLMMGGFILNKKKIQ